MTVADTKVISKITPGELKKIITIPDIAWLTIILLICSLSTQAITVYLLHIGSITNYMAILINSIAIFVSFTPMHDASHGSVACHKYGYINTIIGHCAGCAFPLPFDAFKYLHFQHHKHTNEPDEDPDLFVGGGSAIMLPIKLFSLEYCYYYMYLSRISTRPVFEVIRALSFLAGSYGSLYYLYNHGFSTEVLYGILIPGRIAAAYLALVFDYLPHKPFVSRKLDAFKATCVLSLFDKTTTWMLTWPLLQQNYHSKYYLSCRLCYVIDVTLYRYIL